MPVLRKTNRKKVATKKPAKKTNKALRPVTAGEVRKLIAKSEYSNDIGETRYADIVLLVTSVLTALEIPMTWLGKITTEEIEGAWGTDTGRFGYINRSFAVRYNYSEYRLAANTLAGCCGYVVLSNMGNIQQLAYRVSKAKTKPTDIYENDYRIKPEQYQHRLLALMIFVLALEHSHGKIMFTQTAGGLESNGQKYLDKISESIGEMFENPKTRNKIYTFLMNIPDKFVIAKI